MKSLRPINGFYCGIDDIVPALRVSTSSTNSPESVLAQPEMER